MLKKCACESELITKQLRAFVLLAITEFTLYFFNRLVTEKAHMFFLTFSAWSGVLVEKQKIPILLRIRILSGATRNRISKFKILNYSTLISLEKSPNH